MDRHTNDNTLKRLLGPAEPEVLCDECFERLATTRGALYKTLHDARRKLRARLGEAGLAPGDGRGGGAP